MFIVFPDLVTKIEISLDAAKMSRVWKTMLEDCEDTDNIYLAQCNQVDPQYFNQVIVKTVEYLEHHASGKEMPVENVTLNSSTSNSEVETPEKKWCTWDTNFVNQIKDKLSFFINMINASIWLDIPALSVLLCGTFSNYYLKGKEPEELAKALGVDISGFTPEMEEQVKRENPWIEEKHDDVPVFFDPKDVERGNICKCYA